MRLKLISLSIIFTIMLALIVILYLLLLSHDISMQVVDSSSHNNNGVYLISYADGHDVYLQNQNAMAASAINKGIDFIYSYRKQHLDPEFVARNAHTLAQPRGAGYWLWKPWIILHTLQKMPENAVLIYGDGNTIFKRPVHDLVDLANRHEIILIEHPDFSREQETQASTLAALNCNTAECRKGRNVVACFMVLRNTEKTRKFIEEWLHNCERAEILIDDNSFSPNLYVGHRHDQAILGVLAHHHRADIKLLQHSFIRDHYIATAYRKPQRYDEYYSQNPHIYKFSLFGRIEHHLSNTKPLTMLRELVVTKLRHFPWRETYFQKRDLEEDLVDPV